MHASHSFWNASLNTKSHLWSTWRNHTWLLDDTAIQPKPSSCMCSSVFISAHFWMTVKDWHYGNYCLFPPPNHLHTWTGAVLHEYITWIKEGILEVHKDSSGTISPKGHQHIYTILVSMENKWWTQRSIVQRPALWRIMTLSPSTGWEPQRSRGAQMDWPFCSYRASSVVY